MNKNVQKDLAQLFHSICIESAGKTPSIQKNTLISMLLYHKLDKLYPQYFRYISRSLDKIGNEVSLQLFMKIFTNPEINFQSADKQELADAFSILDPNKTGTIQANQFLTAYKQTQNFLQLPNQKKQQAQDQIQEAFFNQSEQGGKINPMDFYHIVKYK